MARTTTHARTNCRLAEALPCCTTCKGSGVSRHLILARRTLGDPARCCCWAWTEEITTVCPASGGDQQRSWSAAVDAVTGPGQPYELVEASIDGRPHLVFANAPASLRELFSSLRTRNHDEVLLTFEDEQWTIGSLLDCMDRLANALVEHYGVRPGDRVAIAMRNYPEWIASYGAAVSVGAIAVCFNAWWVTDELHYGLVDSDATVFIGDQERIERAAASLEKLGVRGLVVRANGDARIPEGVDALGEVLAAASPVMPDQAPETSDDAMILYTSGTTGHPKGAVSTPRAVLSALLAYGARATVNAVADPPASPHPYPTCFILVVPLFHVTGLVPVMLSCIASGRKLVMLYKWDPERALELIERERVTHFVGVPTMSWDLLESPSFASRDTSSLLSVGGGGAPAPPELVRRVEAGFRNGRPGIGYGMTETNAYGPQNAADDYLRKPRSAGRVLPLMRIAVRDDDGRDLPAGEVGEIWFYGPNLILGYWNQPEATAETMVDGWLRSGDIGRLDDEGFVFVEDRAKDMILRGGENVYCAEVEAVIYNHPAVHEAAVLGLPHERLGEEVAAVVMPRPGEHLDVGTLQAHIAEHLAPFKVPSVVVMVDSPLPRGATGKILKRELRDQLASGHGQLPGR
jgi:long-chain acyl-CoA synthetase